MMTAERFNSQPNNIVIPENETEDYTAKQKNYGDDFYCMVLLDVDLDLT